MPPRALSASLLDRMLDTHGQVVARLAISGDDSNPKGSTIADISELDNNLTLFQEQAADNASDIVLQWNCDHFFSQVSDYFASLLGMASKQHPLALTMFTLNVSRLSHAGLASIQEVLRRSNLEHLRVVCMYFL